MPTPLRNLRLYSTLTHAKEAFTPLDASNVRVYACGPTVYDHLHIGNGRMLIVFDMLFRVLRHIYGAEHVTYARNITDVDDKINARAAERGIPIRALTDAMTTIFHEDAAALGCLPPTVEPRATEHMAEMAVVVERLVARGHAYVAEDHVLFAVGSMSDYGALARRSLDEMIAGSRVEVAPYKRDAMDFVLWKPSKPGEPAWPSPAGIAVPGRPGWHLECSAMAWKHLGEVFDIHGGGIDLVFPHHENEIAQTRCAFGHDVMANVWMHNGHLQVEGEKMSKSLGNFVTIREALTGWKGYAWPGSVIRFAMLGTHYRQPIDWTLARLEEAAGRLSSFRQLAWGAPATRPTDAFLAAVLDDLNTPQAIVELNRMFEELRRDPTNLELAGSLKAGCLMMGIDAATADLRRMRRVDETFVAKRVEDRKAARAAKNWAESDRIRDELASLGIALKDSKDGTTWTVTFVPSPGTAPTSDDNSQGATRIGVPAPEETDTERGVSASDLAVDPSLPAARPDVGPE